MDIKAEIDALISTLPSGLIVWGMAYNLGNPRDGLEVAPVHPEGPTKALNASGKLSIGKDRVHLSGLGPFVGKLTPVNDGLGICTGHPSRVKTGMAEEPTLDVMGELHLLPMVFIQYAPNHRCLCLCIAGSKQGIVFGEPIMSLMVALDEGQLGIFKVFAKPQGSLPGILNGVFVMVKVIAKEHGMVELLGFKPVIGLLKPVVEVRDYQDDSRGQKGVRTALDGCGGH